MHMDVCLALYYPNQPQAKPHTFNNVIKNSPMQTCQVAFPQIKAKEHIETGAAIN